MTSDQHKLYVNMLPTIKVTLEAEILSMLVELKNHGKGRCCWGPGHIVKVASAEQALALSRVRLRAFALNVTLGGLLSAFYFPI